MSGFGTRTIIAALLSISFLSATAQADEIALTFVELSGATGGNPAQTGVYRASLDGLGLDEILSITIVDASFGLGGSPGRFSGFDLDAIFLSYNLATTAGNARLLLENPHLFDVPDVFDFSPAGTIFTPGTQRTPVDDKLFGTGPDGSTVDNAVATLGVFDGNSTVALPPAAPPHANGFVSMGDGGILSFNLTAPLSTVGLYLYIGEVGNQGEVAAGSIFVSSEHVPVPGTEDPQPVPEPATLTLGAIGLAAALGTRRRRR